MKKNFFFAFILFVFVNSNAQNVGIGTTMPTAKLEVHSSTNVVARFSSTSSLSYVSFYENNVQRGYIGSYAGTAEDFDIGTSGTAGSKLHLTIQATPKLTVSNNGYVGIATMDPSYPLDVAGRLRIQNSTGTAGIYFDGLTLPTRSFIGTLNDDHVGMYGSGGAGWNLVMNVENGNTGIGVSAPTAKLDINGSIRIRGGSPAAGSVLTSIDANGNAVWRNDKVAFKVYGMSSAENVIEDEQTLRIHFGGEKFDLGNDYDLLPQNTAPNSNSSTFTVPISGIYHFDLRVILLRDGLLQNIEHARLYLRLERNGVESTLAEIEASRVFVYSSGVQEEDGANFSLTTNESLLVNDKVYVEVFHSTGTTCHIPWGERTWFSGYLVKAN
jgi:hypothetical protein